MDEESIMNEFRLQSENGILSIKNEENFIKFTDLCKNNIDCKKCKYNNAQCFGVKCPDFEPFIDIDN